MTGSFRAPSIAGLIKLHQETIDLHGGAQGAPDEGKLEACVARPGQLEAYGETAVSAAVGAAAICFAIVKIHHPAPDGNERLGLLALNVALGLNGWRLDATERDAERMILAIASGDADETQFAVWVQENAVEREA